MTRPDARVTLIVMAASKPDTDWRVARPTSRLAFLSSITGVRPTLQSAVSHVGLDVERVIVDRAGNADEFLLLLSHLPAQFAGDVVLVRDDGDGYLSATGRGGSRVLYALDAADVRFYLETFDLVTGRAAPHQRAAA